MIEEKLSTVYIEEASILTPEAGALIDATLWGTEDTLYTIPLFHKNLLSIPNVHVLSLKDNDRLVGLRIGIEKTARCADRSYRCIYHTMFTVDPRERGKGYGKRLAQATVDSFGARLGSKGILYAFTETANKRSSAIKNALGYQTIGRFYTTAISRFFPKQSSKVFKLRRDQQDLLQERLLALYQDHALCDLPQSLKVDDYFVLMEGNEIVAGVQVKPQEWRIHRLAGAGGFVALHALPYVPLIRQLFNPKAFRFLSLSNIYFRPGAAAAAHKLMESVLAEYQQKTALLWIDHQSPVYQELSKAGPFGLVNALAETAVDVSGYFIGFEPDEIAAFRSRPLCISPLDI